MWDNTLMPKTTKKAAEATAKTKASESKASQSQTNSEVFRVRAEEVVEKVKEIISEGNARQIILEDKNGKVLFTIPVTFGVLGAIIAPWFAGLGLIAAVVGECTIRVEKE
jgi:hypothetical protein